MEDLEFEIRNVKKDNEFLQNRLESVELEN